MLLCLCMYPKRSQEALHTGMIRSQVPRAAGRACASHGHQSSTPWQCNGIRSSRELACTKTLRSRSIQNHSQCSVLQPDKEIYTFLEYSYSRVSRLDERRADTINKPLCRNSNSVGDWLYRVDSSRHQASPLVHISLGSCANAERIAYSNCLPYLHRHSVMRFDTMEPLREENPKDAATRGRSTVRLACTVPAFFNSLTCKHTDVESFFRQS